MVSRICPQCGLPWYSAAAEETWICPECGAKIPPQEVDVNVQGDKK